MSRPRSQTFGSRALADLVRQLRYSPPPKRAEQVRRAEALHDELDADSAYPFEYLVYRITRYRPERGEDEFIPGDVAAEDLRLLIDTLSRSAPRAADEGDPVHRPDALAGRLGVSPRTLARWRDRGLRWRWWLPEPGGKAALGIPESAWNAFRRAHPDRVEKAGRFTQLDDHQRQRIFDRARELVHRSDAPPPLTRLTRRLAREFNRSGESMRQLVLRHDRDHPDAPLMPGHRGPLSPRQRRFIERAARRGVPLRAIADRLGRSVPAIHRIVQQRRLARLRKATIRFVDLPAFHEEAGLRDVIDRPLPAARPGKRGVGPAVDDLPAAVAAVIAQPPPPWPVQRELIRKMHAMRFAVERTLASTAPRRPRAGALDLAEAHLAEADRLEARLLATNLQTALSVVRPHLQTESEGHTARPAALLHHLALAAQVVRDAIVSFDPDARRTLESVVRNRLLTRFAQEPDADRRALPRPDDAQWCDALLVRTRVACDADARLPRAADPSHDEPSHA